MEEARIDFMDQLGFPYKRMEAGGVFSPVLILYFHQRCNIIMPGKIANPDMSAHC